MVLLAFSFLYWEGGWPTLSLSISLTEVAPPLRFLQGWGVEWPSPMLMLRSLDRKLARRFRPK